MGVLKVWDGTTWQFISAASDGASVYVGPDAPPGTPDTGDMWFDSDQDGTTGTTLPLTVLNGGTGATDAGTARANLGINLPLGLSDGGTAGTTAAAARSSLAVPQVGQSGSTAGAPTSGTWARGDFWIDSANRTWVCTATGTPGTWARVNVADGSWTPWTPTFASGIVALGNATVNAKYKIVGSNTVQFNLRVVMGSTTTYNSSVITLVPPIGTLALTGQTSVGTAGMLDGTNVWIGSVWTDNAGNNFTIQYPTSNTNTATTTMTGSNLTNGRPLIMQAVYETTGSLL